MASQEPDIADLFRRADEGDASAVGQVMHRHRARLRQMITVRIDPRLAARIDPSDVVQDALAQASQKLPEYLRSRPLPFYPWLWRIELPAQEVYHRFPSLYRIHIPRDRTGSGYRVGGWSARPKALPFYCIADRNDARSGGA